MENLQVNLSGDQYDALERGEAVHVSIEQPKAKLVVLSEGTFDRLKACLAPITDEDEAVAAAYRHADEVMKEGWDDPEMAQYDEYDDHKR